MLRATVLLLLVAALGAAEPSVTRTVDEQGQTVITQRVREGAQAQVTTLIYGRSGGLLRKLDPTGREKQYECDQHGRIMRCTWRENGRPCSISVAYDGDTRTIVETIDDLGIRLSVRALRLSWVDGELVSDAAEPVL